MSHQIRGLQKLPTLNLQLQTIVLHLQSPSPPQNPKTAKPFGFPLNRPRFWVVFAERVTRLAGGEGLEGRQMAWAGRLRALRADLGFRGLGV